MGDKLLRLSGKLYRYEVWQWSMLLSSYDRYSSVCRGPKCIGWIRLLRSPVAGMVSMGKGGCGQYEM